MSSSLLQPILCNKGKKSLEINLWKKKNEPLVCKWYLLCSKFYFTEGLEVTKDINNKTTWIHTKHCNVLELKKTFQTTSWLWKLRFFFFFKFYLNWKALNSKTFRYSVIGEPVTGPSSWTLCSDSVVRTRSTLDTHILEYSSVAF